MNIDPQKTYVIRILSDSATLEITEYNGEFPRVSTDGSWIASGAQIIAQQKAMNTHQEPEREIR